MSVDAQRLNTLKREEWTTTESEESCCRRTQMGGKC